MPEDDLSRLIRGGYDRWAGDYVRKFDDELDRKPFDREILQEFATRVQSAGLVLDVGCGPGQIGAYVGAQGCAVAGLDLSFAMLRESCRRRPTMPVVQGSMLQLPFRNVSLAGLVAFYSIFHLRRPDVNRALSEFARVVMPGAPLIIAVHKGEGDIHAEVPLESAPDEPVSLYGIWFQEEPLRRAIEDAGFAIEDLRTRGPYEFEETERIYVLAFRSKRTRP